MLIPAPVVVATLQGGCFVACFITPWVTDRFGRRWCLIGTGVLTAIGVVMQAASSSTGSFAAMFVGRFISGLGVGAASMLTPLYVSECAPRAVRGGLTCKDEAPGLCVIVELADAGNQHCTSFLSSRVPCLPFGMCEMHHSRLQPFVANTNSRINYGCLAHIKGQGVFVVPLVLQAIPAV